MIAKASCVVDEYNQFCIWDEINERIACVNGSRTLNENIPDLLGIRTAYAAYKKHLQMDGEPADRLPGNHD